MPRPKSNKPPRVEKTKQLAYTTKTQALSNHLNGLARKLGPGAKLPTMQQLSADLGISVMTLNRALSELEAQGVLTRRQGSGTYVADRLPTSIGLVYDRNSSGANGSPFVELLLKQAQKRAQNAGERFSLFLADPGEDGFPTHTELLDAVQTRKISGVLAVTRHVSTISYLESKGMPLVALSYRDLAAYRVRIDHAATVRLGVEQLAKKGCKKIALWLPEGVGENGEREAFEAALQEHGLEFQKERIFQTQGVKDARDEGHAAARAQLIESANRPDGVVCTDDDLTLGALAEMYGAGLRAGVDVQIATHTNKGSQLLYAFAPSLIVMEIDPAEIASKMFGLLEDLLAHREIEQKVVAVGPKLAA